MKKNTPQYSFEEIIKNLRSRFRPTVVWEWGVFTFFFGFLIILGITFLVYRYYVVSDATKIIETGISDQSTLMFRQEELDYVLKNIEERISVKPTTVDILKNIDQ